LRAYAGEGNGQIAPVVLQRGRTLYFQKVREGMVKNSCYFAMDATRPNFLDDGELGRRFYVICESDRSFRAISAGHGGGRDLKGIAEFANGRRCAENFSNAMESKLTGARNTASAIRTARNNVNAISVARFVRRGADGAQFRPSRTWLVRSRSFSFNARITRAKGKIMFRGFRNNP
jgi:hypothetical protein